MKLYNQLSKSVEVFTPEDPDNVKIYTCGPTVYSYAHIGNLTSYIYWDFLIRTLKLNGYIPNRVLNLTDVGHLSSDADDGDDKLEKGAKKENLTVWQIADKYISTFLDDFRSLNLEWPQEIARATDYIDEDIKIVDLLTSKGYTYETSDGIYFDTSKFPNYADFAKLDLKNIKAGARVEYNTEKKNPSDFALWKFIKEGEKHDMRWEYLGRPGYPGWHLECSTIIHENLGETIDIHTGGIDHIPVHHTNEIAQTEAAFDKKLARFWLHCNFVTIDGEKISKSLGNIYTLEDLSKKGFSPLDFKMWVLQGHYRTERNFTFEDLLAAKNRLLSWRNRVAKLYQETDTAISANFNQEIVINLASDNLNSPEVLAYIDNTTLTMQDWKLVDQLLGLNIIEKTPDISDIAKQQIKTREQARKNKDYETSDRIRTELENANITILDTENGPIWQYLS